MWTGLSTRRQKITDILERLNNWEKVYPEDYDKPDGHLYVEAADEIERLRVELQSMDDTIVARSELFISDQECLFNLRDRIRRATLEGEK